MMPEGVAGGGLGGASAAAAEAATTRTARRGSGERGNRQRREEVATEKGQGEGEVEEGRVTAVAAIGAFRESGGSRARRLYAMDG